MGIKHISFLEKEINDFKELPGCPDVGWAYDVEKEREQGLPIVTEYSELELEKKQYGILLIFDAEFTHVKWMIYNFLKKEIFGNKRWKGKLKLVILDAMENQKKYHRLADKFRKDPILPEGCISCPFFMVYDRKGNFLRAFTGNISFPETLKPFKKTLDEAIAGK